MNENKIKIELTNEEAIVLFEFLSRFSETEKLEIVDQSEERVLLDLESSLEKILVEPFSGNYRQVLESCRNRLRDKP